MREVDLAGRPRLRSVRTGGESTCPRRLAVRAASLPSPSSLTQDRALAPAARSPRIKAAARKVGSRSAMPSMKPCSPSSRVRGTRNDARYCPASSRFIPARAGNARETTPSVWAKAVHPRACRERDVGCVRIGRLIGSSPRARGTPRDSRLPASPMSLAQSKVASFAHGVCASDELKDLAMRRSGLIRLPKWLRVVFDDFDTR